MSYRELGEARILKRYNKSDYLAPARRPVVPKATKEDWQSLGQATTQFLQHVKPACVTAR
ncbi:hypothetical protein [Terasakiella pusilla]|uniref:hypothetical protein n=1 Tax=Terasakiella pusilla TaxID=64973 RepID=UPI000490A761|nr:hypothetical protein [Terasakiella pusilla]